MSENEIGHVSGGSGPAWGWEPVPHGGEYDSDATAFVQLPQDMLDALDTGEPLAAPGHGYVPPPMIVPLGSASTDPAATGAWTMPVQWPEAGASAQAAAPAPAPVRGPIPASVPIPAAVAAAFARPDDEAQGDARGAAESGGEGDPGATAEWRFPDASTSTGEFQSGDWSQAPTTLPGGAAAPWATHPGFEAPYGQPGPEPQGPQPGQQPGQGSAAAAAMSSGVLPGAPSGAFESGAWAPGAPGRGPRVLGGPGVGTALPAGLSGHEAHSPAEPPAAESEASAPAEPSAPTEDSAPAEPFSPFEDPVPSEPSVPSEAFSPFEDSAPAEATSPSEDSAPFEAISPAEGSAHSRSAVHTEVEGQAESRSQSLPGPEGEPVYPAPHDIEAVHGPAELPPAAERPHPGTGPGSTDGHGFAMPPAPEDERADAQAQAAPDPGEDAAEPAVAAGLGDAGEGAPGTGPTYEEEPHTAAVAQHEHEHPQASYVLRVNGADRPVTGAWIGESLLYVLRERLGLAGAKDGCSQGECGACAVQVDGRLVASCLVPAATAAGSEVRTVEGLATDGELSDVQRALCGSGAVQCGFCVPGMAMTIHDLLEGNHAPTELETRQALCGNLCRCSGYKGVIEAVREVVAGREAAAAAGSGSGSGSGGSGSGSGGPGSGSGRTAMEARIPHQAPPGEGGVHGGPGGPGGPGGAGGHQAQGTQGTHGTHHGGTA
ncbi:2Fe-2S iron-sulfur cluster-binding protein [Streptomyces sp. NPDC091268]|uniref:(2Fe-2S)-binding protein n=1 Tax=Streptomyces sp. NPDC091268 TaxID=3365979 RepID=UPI0037FA1674